jgi:hypothetical protein
MARIWSELGLSADSRAVRIGEWRNSFGERLPGRVRPPRRGHYYGHYYIDATSPPLSGMSTHRAPRDTLETANLYLSSGKAVQMFRPSFGQGSRG